MDESTNDKPERSISSSNGGSVNPNARRISILQKFQNEKAAHERDRDSGKRTNLFSLRPAALSSLASPVKIGTRVMKMKGSFRLSEDRPELVKKTVKSMKVPSASRPEVGGRGSGAVGNMGGASTGSNMRKMLEDLHNTRMRLEQNQKNHERTRRRIDDVDKQVAEMSIERQTVNGTWNDLTETAASKGTELTCLEISDKVVDETLKKAEKELDNDLKELFQIRMATSQMSSKYLSEAISCGMLWNGTAFGHQNRVEYWQEEFENMDRYKRQLEFELEDFLVLQKGVEECKKDREELQVKLDEEEEVATKQEMELQKRIDELDMTLNDFKEEEKEIRRRSEGECERLKREIEEAQTSTTILQNKGKEAKTTIKAQQIPITAPKAISQKRELQHQTRNVKEIGNRYPSSNLPENKPNEGKSFKFQAPVKSILSNGGARKSNLSQRNSFTDGQSGMSISDEDILMAAASEVSQSFRSYEPLTPAPIYDPPPKVRLVERQAPITGFMRQLSSATVIKRPLKKVASQATTQSKANQESQKLPQVEPIRPGKPSSGKSFQFKKKTSSTSVSAVNEENENYSTSHNSSTFPDFNDCDMSNDSDAATPYTTATSFLDDDAFCADFDFGENESESNNTNASVFDRPYAQFNSSRVLLTDSQEERLLQQ